MERERLKWLFKKYFEKSASSSERDELMQYIHSSSCDEIISQMEESYNSYESGDDFFTGFQRDKMLNAIFSEIQENSNSYKKQFKKNSFIKMSRKLSVAATLIGLVLLLGILFVRKYSESVNLKTSETSLPLDIKPGGEKATLTLGDGSVIYLSELVDGKIAEQSGVVITKTSEGQLIYTVKSKFGDSDDNITEPVSYNIIATPRGGQFQVVLPDGTKVWLNAESSLRYPAQFSDTERNVELIGEGFFEVAKSEKVPFVVRTDRQSVIVLGTQFNINTYRKRRIETTLLEGSVLINPSNSLNKPGSITLKPGQQSVLDSEQNISIKEVNLSNAISWKNGFFYFENTAIENVMEEFSRWYDFEFEFEGKMPQTKLWGKVYRNVNASEALGILNYFDLKYRIIDNSKSGSKWKVIISN